MRSLIAASLSVLLFFQNVLLSHALESNFWAERKASAQKTIRLSTLPSLPSLRQGTLKTNSAANAAGLDRRLLSAISPAHGTIRSITPAAGDPAGPVVIHIQDVHQNAEAQANIGRLVESLSASGVPGVVALEGAFGPIDLAPFRDFPHRDVIETVSEYFLRTDRISGAVHAGLTARSAVPPFVGVDDRAHYAANVKAYLASSPRMAEMKSVLTARAESLAAQKRSTFNPELAAFDASVSAYRAGRMPMGDFARLLAGKTGKASANLKTFLRALDLESRLDFDAVEAERERLIQHLVRRLSEPEAAELLNRSVSYRSGNVSYADFYAFLRELCDRARVNLSAYPRMAAYIDYVLDADRIQAGPLFDELNALERSAFAALARSDEERALLKASRDVYLASKLVEFALTPVEWKEYRDGGASSAVAGLAPFEAFYREAEARDAAMSRNLLEAVEKSGASSVVLVTGGFHADGMADRLSRAGATIVSVVPRISRVDAENGSAYLGVFSREKTPLEKIFKGEKLYLAKLVFGDDVRRGAFAMYAELIAALEGYSPAGGRVLDALGAPEGEILDKRVSETDASLTYWPDGSESAATVAVRTKKDQRSGRRAIETATESESPRRAVETERRGGGDFHTSVLSAPNQEFLRILRWAFHWDEFAREHPGPLWRTVVRRVALFSILLFVIALPIFASHFLFAAYLPAGWTQTLASAALYFYWYGSMGVALQISLADPERKLSTLEKMPFVPLLAAAGLHALFNIPAHFLGLALSGSDAPLREPRFVRTRIDGRVARISINHPDQMNAATPQVLTELKIALEKMRQEPGVRFIVLTGAGKTFMAGADLNESVGVTSTRKIEWIEQGQRLAEEIANSGIPVIAAINGDALDGGLELALAAAARVVVADAKVGLTETRLGLIPAWGGTQRLPRLAFDIPTAVRMIVNGEVVTGSEAFALGIADFLLRNDEELEAWIQRLNTLESLPVPFRRPEAEYRIHRERAFNDPNFQDLKNRIIPEGVPFALDDATQLEHQIGVAASVLEAIFAEGRGIHDGLETEKELNAVLTVSEKTQERLRNAQSARAVRQIRMLPTPTQAPSIWAIEAARSRMPTMIVGKTLVRIAHDPALTPTDMRGAQARLGGGLFVLAGVSEIVSRLLGTNDWTRAKNPDAVVGEAVRLSLSVWAQLPGRVQRTFDSALTQADGHQNSANIVLPVLGRRQDWPAFRDDVENIYRSVIMYLHQHPDTRFEHITIAVRDAEVYEALNAELARGDSPESIVRRMNDLRPQWREKESAAFRARFPATAWGPGGGRLELLVNWFAEDSESAARFLNETAGVADRLTAFFQLMTLTMFPDGISAEMRRRLIEWGESVALFSPWSTEELFSGEYNGAGSAMLLGALGDATAAGIDFGDEDAVRLASAMLGAPRHVFLPRLLAGNSYDDRPLPIGWGQTISGPGTVVATLLLLNIGETDAVREIGTGSGWLTGVMAGLAGSVTSFELIPALAQRAAETLRRLGLSNATVIQGDGTSASTGPVDVIVVSAGAPSLPEVLADDLKDGGRLAIPLYTGTDANGDPAYEVAFFIKEGGELHRYATLPTSAWVPLRGAAGWQDTTEGGHAFGRADEWSGASGFLLAAAINGLFTFALMFPVAFVFDQWRTALVAAFIVAVAAGVLARYAFNSLGGRFGASAIGYRLAAQTARDARLELVRLRENGAVAPTSGTIVRLPAGLVSRPAYVWFADGFAAPGMDFLTRMGEAMVIEHETYANHNWGLAGMVFLPLVFWRMFTGLGRGIPADAPREMTSELLGKDQHLRVEDPAFQARLNASARALFQRARDLRDPWWRRWFGLRALSDALIAFASTYPETQKNIFYFTISLGAVQNDPAKVMENMADYLTLGENRALVRIPSQIMVTLARWLGLEWLFGRITLWVVKNVMAKRFFIGEELDQAMSTIETLKAAGLSLTVDNVGEMALSAQDSDNYVAGYLRLTDSGVPAISVKLSNLTPHWTGNAWERVKVPVKAQMKKMIAAAAKVGPDGAEVTIDMEDFVYKDLTIEILLELLEETRYPKLGLAIQAYLRETPKDLERIAETVRRNRLPRPLVRLVKGANMVPDGIEAAAEGREAPQFQFKAETDINYERCAEFLLQNRNAIRPAFGTHNVRSMAVVLQLARELGVKADEFEFQYLHGMVKEEVVRAIRDAEINGGHVNVRFYGPFGPFIRGLGYFVRRLVEKTDANSFLLVEGYGREAEDRAVEDPRSVLRQRLRGELPVATPPSAAHRSPIVGPVADGFAAIEAVLAIQTGGPGSVPGIPAEPFATHLNEVKRLADEASRSLIDLPGRTNELIVEPRGTVAIVAEKLRLSDEELATWIAAPLAAGNRVVVYLADEDQIERFEYLFDRAGLLGFRIEFSSLDDFTADRMSGQVDIDTLAYVGEKSDAGLAREREVFQSFYENLSRFLPGNPGYVAGSRSDRNFVSAITPDFTSRFLRTRVFSEYTNRAGFATRGDDRKGLPGFVNARRPELHRKDFQERLQRQADLLSQQPWNEMVPAMINGTPVRDYSRVLKRTSAADPKKPLSEIYLSQPKDVNHAVESARAAQTAWEEIGAAERAKALLRFADLAERDLLKLAALAMHESGKNAEEAIADIYEAIDFARFYALDAVRLETEEKLRTRAGSRFEHWRTRARGVAAVISPWNFPFAIPAGQITSALVAGNAVIFKPSEESTQMGFELFRLLREAGVPMGVLNFLPGKGEVVGAALVNHPGVDEILFTGSAAVGLQIRQESAAVERPGRDHKHVLAEMGGNNAIIIDEGTDLEAAVKIVLASAFGYSAQKCSACNRVIVVDGVYDEFARRLRDAAEALPEVMGDPRKLGTFFGPLISDEARRNMEAFIERAARQAKGHSVLAQGQVDNPPVRFMIFRDVDPKSPLAQEEQFFPTLSLIRAPDFNAAVHILNDTAYALTGGLISQNSAHIEFFREHARVGNATVNGKITGAMVGQQAFGGSGLSGFSSFHSKAGGMGHVMEHRRWVEEKPAARTPSSAASWLNLIALGAATLAFALNGAAVNALIAVTLAYAAYRLHEGGHQIENIIAGRDARIKRLGGGLLWGGHGVEGASGWSGVAASAAALAVSSVMLAVFPAWQNVLLPFVVFNLILALSITDWRDILSPDEDRASLANAVLRGAPLKLGVADLGNEAVLVLAIDRRQDAEELGEVVAKLRKKHSVEGRAVLPIVIMTTSALATSVRTSLSGQRGVSVNIDPSLEVPTGDGFLDMGFVETTLEENEFDGRKVILAARQDLRVDWSGVKNLRSALLILLGAHFRVTRMVIRTIERELKALEHAAVGA